MTEAARDASLRPAWLRLALFAPTLLLMSAWVVIVLAASRPTSPTILALAVTALVLQRLVSTARVGAAFWRARPAWRRHRRWRLPLCALGGVLAAAACATGAVRRVTETGRLGLMPR